TANRNSLFLCVDPKRVGTVGFVENVGARWPMHPRPAPAWHRSAQRLVTVVNVEGAPSLKAEVVPRHLHLSERAGSKRLPVMGLIVRQTQNGMSRRYGAKGYVDTKRTTPWSGPFSNVRTNRPIGSEIQRGASDLQVAFVRSNARTGVF